jgi:hypothetical protein
VTEVSRKQMLGKRTKIALRMQLWV